MASTYKTPGVYIEEKNAFPGSAVAVDTAVPVFIGYTEKAERNGKSLSRVPTRITSIAEYAELFGGAFQAKYTVKAGGGKESFKIGSTDYIIEAKDTKNYLNFFNSLRLFYQNGGSTCYILSIGQYGGTDGLDITKDAYMGATATATDPAVLSVFDILKKEFEPTLIVMPELSNIDKASFYSINQQALIHCLEMQSRFCIFDVRMTEDTADADIAAFRTDIGTTALNYGAAYYPYLKSSIVSDSELNFLNITNTFDALKDFLPDDEKAAVTALLADTTFAGAVKDAIPDPAAAAPATPPTLEEKIAAAKKKAQAITNVHQSFKAVSPTYNKILTQLKDTLNLLPPSPAMAGVYTLVDNTRGVWKAPANVSVSSVNAPVVNISHDEQQNMNVDAISGKSINIIRPFPSIGTLVWGARTLDGNSQDWKYINVRRTLIMVEQSLKLATRTYVFEPNDSATWVTISSMMNNFLYNLWKQGALAGGTPEEAYSVAVGLGSTMTPNDILDGFMRITVKVAIVRPAEFIVITFQQQQQTS